MRHGARAEAIFFNFPFSSSSNRHPSARQSLPQLIGALFIACLFVTSNTFAADFVWGNTSANASWGTASSWTNSFGPGAGPGTFLDNIFITNNLSSPFESRQNNSYNINNLVATNTGTALRTIVINNGLSLRAAGTSTIGSNTLLNVGSTSTGGSTFSNNNLNVVENGIINLLGPGTLTVAGVFSNSVTSIISNGTGGASVRLQFLDGTLTVTNRGAMNFTRLDLTGATTDTNLVVQVGTAGTGTFRNEGVFVTGIGGTTADKSRAFVFSNTFVNAGMFVLTNGNTGARSTNLFSVVGFGITNQATGTIKLTSISGSTGPRNVMTLNAGGFVNAGTLISDAGGSASISNVIFLATGQTFSNAAGGQVILDSTQAGQLAIYADKAVNAGTNSISSGTLNYFTSSGGAGILQNSGTILLTGGNLNVDTVTNTATGTIKATTGNNAFNLVNAGTIDLTTAVLSNGTSGTTWTTRQPERSCSAMARYPAARSTISALSRRRPDWIS